MSEQGLAALGYLAIDVESERVNAFPARDEALLRECARRLLWLWES